ncbi:MAG: hypothetical protein WAW37_05185 [Syntrophobacteraceae bacterium]
MQVSKIYRRIANLEADVRKLHARIRELEGKADRPRFVPPKKAEAMYGISAATLRFRCQAGKLIGTAFKKDGRWLIDVNSFEERIRSGEKEDGLQEALNFIRKRKEGNNGGDSKAIGAGSSRGKGAANPTRAMTVFTTWTDFRRRVFSGA